MHTSGYLVIVTAHYSDESSLDLEMYECKDIYETNNKLEACELKYKSALSKELFKNDFIKINVRVFELNIYIPKLVSSFELKSSAGWSGWSNI